jgi:hypothetical protein
VSFRHAVIYILCVYYYDISTVCLLLLMIYLLYAYFVFLIITVSATGGATKAEETTITAAPNSPMDVSIYLFTVRQYMYALLQ